MGVYTPISPSFLDYYVAGSNAVDAKAKARKEAYMQGMKDLIGAGADAYKFSQRKNAAESIDDDSPLAQMAKHDWIYGGNAGTYNSYLADKRADAQIQFQREQAAQQAKLQEELTKATRDASDSSALQSALKQNTLDLEASEWRLKSAAQQWQTMMNQPDSQQRRDAEMAYNREVALYTRLKREYNQLRQQQIKKLGVDPDATSDEPVSLPVSIAEPVSVPSASSIESLAADAKQIVVSKTPIAQTDKNANVAKLTSLADEYDKLSKDASLTMEQRQQYSQNAADARAMAANYSKQQKTKEGAAKADQELVARVSNMQPFAQANWVRKNPKTAKRLKGSIAWKKMESGSSAYDYAFSKVK